MKLRTHLISLQGCHLCLKDAIIAIEIIERVPYTDYSLFTVCNFELWFTPIDNWIRIKYPGFCHRIFIRKFKLFVINRHNQMVKAKPGASTWADVGNHQKDGAVPPPVSIQCLFYHFMLIFTQGQWCQHCQDGKMFGSVGTHNCHYHFANSTICRPVCLAAP